jgi:ectoine hydroxylase-related dioxygenase (phytanoyl-CoA dioxygenase family)
VTATLSAHHSRRPVIFKDPGPEMLEYFRENGFAVLGDAFSPTEVAEINKDAERLCRGEYGTIDTGKPLAGVRSTDELMRQFLCIHYPHKVSEVAMGAMKNPRVIAALTGLIGPNVKAMQSMLFIKSEGKPGQAWHQDEYFIPTRDRSLTAAWIALDDATVENGCLWALPGSHRPGVLYPARDQTDPRFDCTTEAYDFPYRDEDAVPLEVPAGAAVIFNGYLLHRSLQNSGAHGYRRALVNHYMSAESLLPWKWPTDGTHMAAADCRDIVLVAGRDPYRHKGLEDINRPHSRRDKDGGCDR